MTDSIFHLVTDGFAWRDSEGTMRVQLREESTSTVYEADLACAIVYAFTLLRD